MNPTAKRAFSSVLVVASLVVSQGCDHATPVPRPTSAVSGRSDEVVRAPDAVDSAPGAATWRCFASARWRPADCPTRLAPLSMVTAATTFPPFNPAYLSGNVERSRVTLSWQVVNTLDNAATSFVLEAGSRPGLTDIATFDTANAGLNLYVDDVPAGTYYVRVKGKNELGLSGPSNEIVLSVGRTGPLCVPEAPASLSFGASFTTVTLTWTAFAAGTCAPTSYIVEVGSSTGLTDATEIDTGTTFSTFTFVTTNIAPGAYYVRVRAASGGFKSAPTAELAFGISPGCITSFGGSTLRYSASGGLNVIYLFGFPCGSPDFSFDVPWLTRGSAPPTTHFVFTAVAIAPNTTGAPRAGHVIYTTPYWTVPIKYVQDAQ